MRPVQRIALLLTLVLGVATSRLAYALDETDCFLARHRAAGKYAKCMDDFFGKSAAGGNTEKDVEKCVAKYVAVWPKLQGKYAGTGTTCELARFVDNGDGTVTDRLTNLQWEQKDGDDGVPAPANRHDVDNTYSWSVAANVPDGTAYTDLLATLNTAGSCFTGRCDWRLPSIAELYSIGLTGIACTGSTCVDATFGPNGLIGWTSTMRYLQGPWLLIFNGSTALASGLATNAHPTRAVRGSL